MGPVYGLEKRKGGGRERALLRGVYRRCLELAKEYGGGSLAFCAVSTGVYGYPSGEAAEVAVGEVRAFLEEEEEEERSPGGGLDRVVFCCWEMKDVRAYEEWLP